MKTTNTKFIDDWNQPQEIEIRGKNLSDWLKKLKWRGGTIHQVEREINDKFYILKKLRMIEGLNYWDKLRINESEAILISIQNEHKLPRKGKQIIHSRQIGLGNSFIGKDDLGFFIGLC